MHRRDEHCRRTAGVVVRGFGTLMRFQKLILLGLGKCERLWTRSGGHRRRCVRHALVMLGDEGEEIGREKGIVYG